jgi:hypothetical protein
MSAAARRTPARARATASTRGWRRAALLLALTIALLGAGPCRQPDLGPTPPRTPDSDAPIMPEPPVAVDRPG